MLERRSARGSPTPALEARVELRPGLDAFWDAFQALHAGRVVGWTPQPIPLAEVEAYCRLHGIEDPDERAEFARFVRAMDTAWLEWAAGQQQAADEAAAPRAKGRSRR